jgi:hypothetical protein
LQAAGDGSVDVYNMMLTSIVASMSENGVGESPELQKGLNSEIVQSIMRVSSLFNG